MFGPSLLPDSTLFVSDERPFELVEAEFRDDEIELEVDVEEDEDALKL